MKKRILAFLLIAVLAMTLVACGGDDKKTEEPETEGTEGTETTETDETETSDLSVGMVTDEGGVNDQSFNQSAWEGLQKVEEDLGITTKYQESEQEQDFVPNFETLLDNDFDMMWGVGYKLSDATYNAALDNPEKFYGIIDFSYDDNPDFPEGTPENLVGVLFKDNESSFLAGYVAGRMTETDKVGFVGGIEGDVIGAFEHGYLAGVQYAANELGKEIEVISQYADSFSDAAKGKSMASNMFQQGADIVFHASGGVGDGVIEAAKEADKWAIGVDRDQSYLAPENVLTSVIKRVDQAIYKVVEDFKNDKFEGGHTVVYGLKDEGVGLAETSSEHVPADILEDVETLKTQVIDGEIDVPNNAETYETFLEGLGQ